ncbi:LysM peptidoglycan-binding domain-containing protein [Paenibacillus sp. SI8]|uniref:LysM peptidoglycan-binding domain-containing protein n=1 Tax=unclassified Paenibacillus TaxID=185978 RepID=UPI0034665151
MAEQQPGLRFDIYERVHLHEGLAGIQELNDVELLPHIQVITLDDQAILKGNLLLTGNYSSIEGEEPRSLEHLIPVEITLPLNRIHRVDDIQIEIENFDVDLLSARSLNVTGVLSLTGVEMVSAPIERWREEEEITFIHQADFTRNEPAPPTSPHEPVPTPYQEPTYPYTPAPEPEPELVNTAPLVQQEPVVQEVEPPADSHFVVEVESTELKVTPHQENTVVTEEKKELKVAFGKKANEAVDINPYGIKSLLSKAGAVLSDKRKEGADAQAAEDAKIDAVEWKRLFLQSSAGSQEFRKLKMCIVQREETLETIAKKYQVNPRELQLLNRLSDQEVSAGQVIYLPK